MARAGISGIFIPFTGEPHYDAHQPASSLPFTLAHEMAHQRGFAFESEANFVAAVVCLRSDHPYIRHSGWAGAPGMPSVTWHGHPSAMRLSWR
jgi:hypothetical protein